MWIIKDSINIGLMVQLFLDNDEDLPEIINDLGSNVEVHQDSMWVKCSFEGLESVYIYRKRLIVFEVVNTDTFGKRKTFDDLIRFVINKKQVWESTLLEKLPKRITKIKVMPFAFIDTINHRRSKNIIDDDITSFEFKIFNNLTGKFGFVRVSRHIIIGGGLSTKIKHDIINLCYEKLLTHPEKITSKDIFNFIDGLNRYTLPSEENVYFQNLIFRATFFIGAISLIGNYVTAKFDYKAVILLVLSLPFLWKLVEFIVVKINKITDKLKF